MKRHPSRPLVVRAYLVTAVLLIALPIAAGCAKGPSFPAARIGGKVTIDGQPAPPGKLNFVPEPGTTGQADSAEINGGQFLATRVPQGKVRVLFNITVDSGEFDRSYSQPTPIPKNIVPEKYWPGVVIDVSGDNLTQDFALVTGGT